MHGCTTLSACAECGSEVCPACAFPGGLCPACGESRSRQFAGTALAPLADLITDLFRTAAGHAKPPLPAGQAV